MDIYTKTSNWKIILLILGMTMLVVTLVYSNYLAGKLKDREEKDAKLYTLALAKNTEGLDSDDGDIGLNLEILTAITLPVILENEMGKLDGYNFANEDQNKDETFLEKKKEDFLASGKEPFKGDGYATYVYYFNSPLLSYIRYFPMVQALLVSLFILLGYILLNISKKAEQNRVWAGMAKETAHQLGTPVSAIIAWIEHMKMTKAADDPEQMDIIKELTNDVKKLELIADRFSKIGSAPSLTRTNIYEELDQVKNYMMRRSSKKIVFEFPAVNSDPIYANINRHLFDWVMENLMRNALDAMDGKGTISVDIYEERENVCIDLKDTGKGISSSKFKTVFLPGFSTKQRGWGLGLSLAKRIIEDYHKGKIFVKSSKINEGTTFSIKIPKI